MLTVINYLIKVIMTFLNFIFHRMQSTNIWSRFGVHRCTGYSKS